MKMETSHFRCEAKLLIRQFDTMGFNCAMLITSPMFRAALKEYSRMNMTFDQIHTVARHLADNHPELGFMNRPGDKSITFE